jgi:thiol-disulfide isomerase/thioredoxin
VSRLPVSQRAFAVITLCALAAAVATYVVLDNASDDTAESLTTRLTLEPPAPRVSSLEDVTVTRYDESETTLGALLDGRPTVVNFFGSWCVPCVTEMPAFQAVADEVGDEVSFVGLAVNDRAEDAQRIVEQTRVRYPTLLDDDGLAFAFFGAIQMPATGFIGADGTTVDRVDGAMTETELRGKLTDLYGVGG